jgi:hypothetical protein
VSILVSAGTAPVTQNIAEQIKRATVARLSRCFLLWVMFIAIRLSDLWHEHPAILTRKRFATFSFAIHKQSD